MSAVQAISALSTLPNVHPAGRWGSTAASMGAVVATLSAEAILNQEVVTATSPKVSIENDMKPIRQRVCIIHKPCTAKG
jgi:hypothetical protein